MSKISVSTAINSEFNNWYSRYRRINRDSNIVINLEYLLNHQRHLLFIITDTIENFEFIIEYDSDYPISGVRFSADWRGVCDTAIFCNWIAQTSQLINGHNKSLSQTLDIIIFTFNRSTITLPNIINKRSRINVNLENYQDEFMYEQEMEFLEDEEAEILDVFDKTQLVDINPTLLSLENNLLHKYRNNPLISITSNVGRNLKINTIIKGIPLNFNIDFNRLFEYGPIATLENPMLEFDGIVPITPFGLLVIPGLTPKTWKPQYIDIIEKIYQTMNNTNFIVKDKRDYDKSTSLVGYQKLLPSSNPTQFSKQLKVKQSSSENTNRVLISIKFLNTLSMIRKNTFPIFEIETSLGMKTISSIDYHNENENIIILPTLVARNLLIYNKLNIVVNIKLIDPPLGTYISLRDEDEAFFFAPDHNEIVQTKLSNYYTLTEGDLININGHKLEVIKCEPEPSIKTVGQDIYSNINVNYLVPSSYTQPLDPLYIPSYGYAEDEEEEEIYD